MLRQYMQAPAHLKRREKSLHSFPKPATREPSIGATAGASEEHVQQRLTAIKVRRDDARRRNESNKQYGMVEVVAQRVCNDMRACVEGQLLEDVPLRWCMHSGPGTGQSHLNNLFKRELFEPLSHWNIGVELNIVLLLSVMAELLDRVTIHDALGIQVFGSV